MATSPRTQISAWPSARLRRRELFRDPAIGIYHEALSSKRHSLNVEAVGQVVLAVEALLVHKRLRAPNRIGLKRSRPRLNGRHVRT